MATVNKNKTVLEAKDFRIYYSTKRGYVKAVDGVSFSVYEGETLGIVGESGCGKSTLGQGILKLLPPSTKYIGQMRVVDTDIVPLNEQQMRKVRGKLVGMIFQDPMTALNPIIKVEKLFYETLKEHEPTITKEQAAERTAKILEKVGIEPVRMREYPFQFSGGMRQRVMIALALVLNPYIVIADEPTTSLDVIVQAQILELLNEIRKEYNSSMILITHDLGVVAEMADRIAVMYAGHMVEIAPKYDIYYFPKHPYTQLLLKSIPNTNPRDLELNYIPGSPPFLLNPEPGCRFASRCPFKMQKCETLEPPMYKVEGTQVKCWLYESHVENEVI
ncbi:MAG: ABC transporter ATP-binding protein [Fervidobacterium sp.]